jgi:hypothetical protein
MPNKSSYMLKLSAVIEITQANGYYYLRDSGGLRKPTSVATALATISSTFETLVKQCGKGDL